MMGGVLTQEARAGSSGAPLAALPPFAATLQGFWKGEVLWHCQLAHFTTLKVGGPAQAVIMPSRIPQLALLIKGLRQHAIPWRIMGRGSNILVPDDGFPGVVIVMGQGLAAIRQVAEDADGVIVEVEAGCGLARLVKWTMAQGLSGLEFAAGIPGSVGGTIVMNAGAFGGAIGDHILAIGLMDGQGAYHVAERRHCRFSYRGLTIDHPDLPGPVRLGKGGGRHREDVLVLAGTFRFTRGVQHEVADRCRALNAKRKASQPQGMASAGSFFKNPPEAAAGRLIDEAGLKGARVGRAVISPKHANFIVNAGNATARDIVELMHLVQETVWKRAGIRLEPEVDIWQPEGGERH